MSDIVERPFFARLWMAMSAREPESLRRLRRENLLGLSGRVLEVGAGTGTNFAYYPRTVTEVVALEPERSLAARAARAAADSPVPVAIDTGTVEGFTAEGEFDAVVCSLVLCSVDDPENVVGQLYSLLRPGGQLRYLEHVAGIGTRARLQKFADATVWPRIAGNCHSHRHTEETIVGAGFRVTGARREWTFPAWIPLPVAEFALGVAIKPG